MLNLNIPNASLDDFKERVLHSQAWEELLGPSLFSEMIKNGSLFKPRQDEIHEQVLDYYHEDMTVSSEIYCESDCVVITPVEPGFKVVKKSFSEIDLLRCTHNSISEHVRQVNKLDRSSLSSREDFFIVGEKQFKASRMLVVLYTGKNSVDHIRSMAPIKEWNSYSKVFLLSTSLQSDSILAIAENVLLMKYELFKLMPSSFLRQSQIEITCREIAETFCYPILISAEENNFYLFGIRMMDIADTKIYKYVKALVDSFSMLPMTTELFFSKNPQVTTEHYASAIKEIRKQLKKIIEKKIVDEALKIRALNFFELGDAKKEKGDINLRVTKLDVHIC